MTAQEHELALAGVLAPRAPVSAAIKTNTGMDERRRLRSDIPSSGSSRRSRNALLGVELRDSA
jgi:hypothetical protein